MIVFKNWLPDQPPLGLDGLTEAENLLPMDDASYSSFQTATTQAVTVPGVTANAVVQGAMIATKLEFNQECQYVAAGGKLYLNSGGFFTATTATMHPLVTDNDRFAFIQHKDFVIVCNKNNPTQVDFGIGMGVFSGLATAGSVPYANIIGAINEIVMLGDLRAPVLGGTEYPSYVQWSAIGDARNWPTPGSSTAIASQAGEQDLGKEGGQVTAILGGDQFGVILQTGRVTRCTYIGGTDVFQFDTLEDERGCYFPKSAIRIGDTCYYIARAGFMRTNGVAVENIGYGAVNDYFWSRVNITLGIDSRISSAYDEERNQIYWAWPSTTVHPTNLLIFNILNSRWTLATTESGGVYSIMDRPSGSASSRLRLRAFNTARALVEFSGAPGTAIITTGETEGNEGGYTFVGGVKPIVDATAGAMTMAVGTRNDQQSSPTYTSEVSVNSRSGFCGFRSEARYHRARLTLTGTFTAAQGLEVQATPTGKL